MSGESKLPAGPESQATVLVVGGVTDRLRSELEGAVARAATRDTIRLHFGDRVSVPAMERAAAILVNPHSRGGARCR